MESKAFYIKRLLSTFGICIIGLLISSVVFSGFTPFKGSVFLTTVIFSGLPFGWMALRKVFGGVFFGGIFGTILYFILMIALSLTIGWMILCWRLFRDLTQLILAWRAEKCAPASEQ